jgi:phospholipase/carboxylesterase
MRIQTLGGLKAVITGGSDGEGGGDGPVIVLCHGFGAPGDVLVPLAEVFAQGLPGVRWVFPAAPLDLPMGFGDARAWWMIDLAKIELAIERGEQRNLSRDVPAGLAEARKLMLALLDDVEAKLGAKRIVLGGFSQGAMLSMDVALRSPRQLAGVVLMSGTLLAEAEWQPLMAGKQSLRVFQSHGSRDPLLPFDLAERLRDLLREAGVRVDWVPFRGGHEIPRDVLVGLDAFLRDVLA